MNRPVARYVSSRRYLSMALLALAGAAVSAVAAFRWPGMLIPAAVCAFFVAVLGSCLLVLALRPSIEIHETHLMIGRRAIPWAEIHRVDQTGWNAPLAVYLTLAGEERVLLVHPGDPDCAGALLRHLRRYSREALLDGIPHAQFWGESPAPLKQLPAPRYPLLRPEDEEEIERLFQRLKSVGRLDHRTDSDPQ